MDQIPAIRSDWFLRATALKNDLKITSTRGTFPFLSTLCSKPQTDFQNFQFWKISAKFRRNLTFFRLEQPNFAAFKPLFAKWGSSIPLNRPKADTRQISGQNWPDFAAKMTAMYHFRSFDRKIRPFLKRPKLSTLAPLYEAQNLALRAKIVHSLSPMGEIAGPPGQIFLN